MDNTRTLKKTDKNVLHIGFLRALTKIRTFEKEVIKNSKLRITPKELNYLALIETGSMQQKDLLSLLDVSKGTLSNMVKLLVKKGFLTRESDKEDKRIKRLMLTSKGKKAIKINDKIRQRVMAYILRKVSKKELDTFLTIALKCA